jgi:hypothetical protein
MQRLWESDSFIDDNTLTVNVAPAHKLAVRWAAGLDRHQKGPGYISHQMKLF